MKHENEERRAFVHRVSWGWSYRAEVRTKLARNGKPGRWREYLTGSINASVDGKQIDAAAVRLWVSALTSCDQARIEVER